MSDTIANTLVEVEETAEDTMRNKYLVFYLDNQEFAIAIEFVIDIINVQPMTRVPNVPGYVRGITNLRGKVIPIVDVSLRFGKEQQEYNDRTCIIVVEVNNVQVGLVIDQVSEVITLDDGDIAPPPSFTQGVDSRYIQGIGKTDSGVKLILDCKTVLYDEWDLAEQPEGAE